MGGVLTPDDAGARVAQATSAGGRSYQAALDYLFARTTGAVRPGLERTEALLAAMGDPHRRLRVLHVAGTNGKGSVCATLDAVLRARGHRVGKYTSPHLVDFRERIVVDGAPIAEHVVTKFVERWAATCERVGATFFEATTALAFQVLADAGVDVAVIETGLGGRWDSTNVVAPLGAAVTSIARDHTEYLGDTLEAIADEKAGIFKRGAAAVIGEVDEALRNRLAASAAAAGSAPIVVVSDGNEPTDVRVSASGTEFTMRVGGAELSLCTPLVGDFQARNAATAIALLESVGLAGDPATLGDALQSVALPGRFQRSGRWIFDVAHNPHGANALAETLRRVGIARPATVVAAVLSDKDWRGMLTTLAGVADRMVITVAPTAPVNRRWDLDEVRGWCAQQGIAVQAVVDFGAALAAADAGSETVIVTGSFHTVGDAMARLHLSPVAA